MKEVEGASLPISAEFLPEIIQVQLPNLLSQGIAVFFYTNAILFPSGGAGTTLEAYRDAVLSTLPTPEVAKLLENLVESKRPLGISKFERKAIEANNYNFGSFFREVCGGIPGKRSQEMLERLPYDQQFRVILEEAKQAPARVIIEKIFSTFLGYLNMPESIRLFQSTRDGLRETLVPLELDQEKELRKADPSEKLFWLQKFLGEMFYVSTKEVLETSQDCQKAAENLIQTQGFGSSLYSVQKFVNNGAGTGLRHNFWCYRFVFDLAVKNRWSGDQFRSALKSCNPFLSLLAAMDMEMFLNLELNMTEPLDDETLKKIQMSVSPIYGKQLEIISADLYNYSVDAVVLGEQKGPLKLDFYSDFLKARMAKPVPVRHGCPARATGTVGDLWQVICKTCLHYGIDIA